MRVGEVLDTFPGAEVADMDFEVADKGAGD